jgi:8-oxo-dGTP pyrophosphatase MutT (NUDIX family)
LEHPIRVRATALVVRGDAVLLIAYDEPGVGYHFNLPGGGVELGETLAEAVAREVMEEAAAHVSVGPLALVYEYVPSITGHRYGPIPQIHFLFECALAEGAEPALPAQPDPHEVAVVWLPVSELPQAPGLGSLGPAVARWCRERGPVRLATEVGLEDVAPLEA